MIRLTTNPNAVANHYFQNLAAVGAKAAAYAVVRAFFTPGSALYGKGAAVLFIHDEIISELREETAHEAALEQSRIMVEAMQVHVPDVKISAPPALMRRWYKGAEAVYVDGRLAPWEPLAKPASAR
jgi:DNA polymerase I-like protein with 3'-5' exonuclease and polymerase domains